MTEGFPSTPNDSPESESAAPTHAGGEAHEDPTVESPPSAAQEPAGTDTRGLSDALPGTQLHELFPSLAQNDGLTHAREDSDPVADEIRELMHGPAADMEPDDDSPEEEQRNVRRKLKDQLDDAETQEQLERGEAEEIIHDVDTGNEADDGKRETPDKRSQQPVGRMETPLQSHLSADSVAALEAVKKQIHADQRKEHVESSRTPHQAHRTRRVPVEDVINRKQTQTPPKQVELEHALLTRLKTYKDWDNYRFTGELTSDGYLIERGTAEDNPAPSRVRPRDIVHVKDFRAVAKELHLDEYRAPETQEVPDGHVQTREKDESDTGSGTSARPEALEDQVQAREMEVFELENTPAPQADVRQANEQNDSVEAVPSVVETQQTGVDDAQDAVPARSQEDTQRVREQLEEQQDHVPPRPDAGAGKPGAHDITKEQTPVVPPTAGEKKSVVEGDQSQFQAAREQYRALRSEMLEARSAWEDAVQQYQDVRQHKGFLGKIFDTQALDTDVNEKHDHYLALLERMRAAREIRMQAFIKTRSTNESYTSSKTVTSEGAEFFEGKDKTGYYAAFHEALLDRRIDQDVLLLEHMKASDKQPESSNRYWGAVKQFGRMYSQLSMKQKIAFGAAAGFGIGALGAAGTGSALVMFGLGGVAAARRASGVIFSGTVGGSIAGAIKGFADRQAGKFVERRTKDTKEVFQKTALKETLAQRLKIQKTGKAIRTAGTVGAVGTAIGTSVAVGAGIGHALHEALPGALADAGHAADTAHTADAARGAAAPEVVQSATPHNVLEHLRTSSGDYVVKPGDTIWSIIRHQLASDGHFKTLTEHQQVELVDSIKDKVVQMSGEQLHELGVTSGNPALIHSGETIKLSAIFEQSIEGHGSAPADLTELTDRLIAQEHAHVLTAVHDTVPAETPAIDTAPGEPVPSGQYHQDLSPHGESVPPPFDSVSSHTQPPFSSISSMEPQASIDHLPADEGVRAGDFPRAWSDFERVHAMSVDLHANSSRPVLENLFTKERIFDRQLMGQYNNIRSHWDVISRVDVHDALDGNKQLVLDVGRGAPIVMGSDSEGLVRSMLGQIERFGGSKTPAVRSLVEQAQREHWTVGRLMNEVGKQLQSPTAPEHPQPVATLAALDARGPAAEATVHATNTDTVETKYVSSNSEAVESPTGMEVTEDRVGVQVAHHSSAGDSRVPTTEPYLPRPTQTEPIFRAEVGGAAENNDVVAGGRVGIKIGGGQPIQYVDVHTHDPISPQAEALVQKLVHEHPSWATTRADELLKNNDPEFIKLWRHYVGNEEGKWGAVSVEGKGGAPLYRAPLDPNDVKALKGMSGSDALKQLEDQLEEYKEINRPHVPFQIYKRFYPFRR